ncbi:MAG: YkgJ family cysteine cluster protein [Deltaproteobacteria bacterium]|nr:YkgJ family cysteine cluster protein [Deltaproteobacteria bacterium]
MNKVYAMTDSLGGILKEYSNDINATIKINQALDFYIEQYKELAKDKGNLTAIHSYHVELDEQVKAKKIKVPELAKDIKCKMGCSHCCYNDVCVSRDEAALIKSVIENRRIVIDMSMLRKQAKEKSKSGRCVFLNNMGLCMIYEHRPAACRKLLIITDPELCNLETINKVGRFVDWHIEVIASAILNGSDSGSLPKMLLKEL